MPQNTLRASSRSRHTTWVMRTDAPQGALRVTMGAVQMRGAGNERSALARLLQRGRLCTRNEAVCILVGVHGGR